MQAGGRYSGQAIRAWRHGYGVNDAVLGRDQQKIATSKGSYGLPRVVSPYQNLLVYLAQWETSSAEYHLTLVRRYYPYVEIVD